MTESDIPSPFGLDVLTQMALHKRANLPTMIGLLYHHLGQAQATADMLLKCAQADLVDWNNGQRQFIVMWNLTADTQEELERFQFPCQWWCNPKRSPITSSPAIT